ncbi:hypothetical protein [Micromonospora sp. NBS 11-29]|uniref:hypothetical protein n=1 Tax=Micromonospora sp. NBS 11-29 TaxID=1960879 RepID=UPI000B7823CF|nr:hypothetical protein [Micromonospora sp. NBS 11-29]
MYGITGEAMINFGLLGGVLSFAVYGFVVRLVGRWYRTARQGTALAPQLLAAMAWALAIIVVSADLGNLIDFNLGFTMPVVLLVLLSSGRPGARRAGPDLLDPVPHRRHRPGVGSPEPPRIGGT